MKILTSSIITYLCTMIAGILFIIFRDDSSIIGALTVIIAIIFLVPGVVNFITALRGSRKNQQSTGTSIGMMLVSAGAVALGILMLVFPPFFANYVAFTLGILLALCGIYQTVWVLRSSTSPKHRWFVVGAILVVIAGIVAMILQADKFTPGLWLFTGIVLIIYSLNGFIALKALPARRREFDSNTVVIK